MRAAIFIDGAHLLKQIGDARITPDYSRLAEYFLAPLRRNIPLDLLRCYFYYCPPWMSAHPTEDELRRKANWDRFISELEDLDRWQVRLGKLERRREGDKDVFSQKRVDVLLSVDMVRHAAAGHVQHVVLVAGDSDFIPAVEAVKDSGTTVTLWAATDRSAHLDLIHAADEVQYLRWKNFPQKTKEASRNAPPPPELGRAQRAGHPGQQNRGRAAPALHTESAPEPPPVMALVAATSDGEAEGGSDAGEGGASSGKKKRRGRRGGRGRNKNRGLALAADADADAGAGQDGGPAPEDRADSGNPDRDARAPAAVVALQSLRGPPAGRDDAAAPPVTWRYADEDETAARPFGDRGNQAASGAAPAKEPRSDGRGPRNARGSQAVAPAPAPAAALSGGADAAAARQRPARGRPAPKGAKEPAAAAPKKPDRPPVIAAPAPKGRAARKPDEPKAPLAFDPDDDLGNRKDRAAPKPGGRRPRGKKK